MNLYKATIKGEAANWICGKCCGFVPTDRTTTPLPIKGLWTPKILLSVVHFRPSCMKLNWANVSPTTISITITIFCVHFPPEWQELALVVSWSPRGRFVRIRRSRDFTLHENLNDLTNNEGLHSGQGKECPFFSNLIFLEQSVHIFVCFCLQGLRDLFQ